VFVIAFDSSAFPPEAEDEADQLTYRATVEFTGTSGGFTQVDYLNTLRVDFTPTEAPDPVDVEEVVIWYPDEAPPQTNVESLVVNDLDGSAASYEVASFRGQNALTNTLVQETTTVWQLDLSGSGADFLTGSFTVEYFQRIEPFADGNSIVEVDISVGLDFGLLVQGVSSDGVGEGLGILVVGPDADPREWYGTTDLSNFAHVAIQRISGNRMTVHYKGTKIYDQSVGDAGAKINQLQFLTVNSGTGQTAISQIRISNSAIYGDGTFSPPTGVFHTP
jgi:hypothetical protein